MLCLKFGSHISRFYYIRIQLIYTLFFFWKIDGLPFAGLLTKMCVCLLINFSPAKIYVNCINYLELGSTCFLLKIGRRIFLQIFDLKIRICWNLVKTSIFHYLSAIISESSLLIQLSSVPVFKQMMLEERFIAHDFLQLPGKTF